MNKIAKKTYSLYLKLICFTIALFFCMVSASAVTKNLPLTPPEEFDDNVKDVPIDNYVFIMGIAGCALVYFVLHKKETTK